MTKKLAKRAVAALASAMLVASDLRIKSNLKRLGSSMAQRM